MANIALIIAGGVGSRTQQSIPKQFISVADKPIVLYTLEKFQTNPEIDKIALICLKGWESYILAYAKQFNISKLEYIVPGGESGFESISNGLTELKKHCCDDDVILIHDGTRPGITHKMINECIETIKTKGNVVTYIPTTEVVFDIENKQPTLLNRDNILRTQTPQGATFKETFDIFQTAKEKGLTDSIAFCSLLSKLGKEINFIRGNEKNFKITFKEDIDLFKGLISIGE